MTHSEGGVYNVERAAALVLDTDSHFHHSRYLNAGKKTQNHQTKSSDTTNIDMIAFLG